MMGTPEDEFWIQPLGAWLRDVSTGNDAVVAEKLWRLSSRRDLEPQYKEICDGVLLTLLFHEIEPRHVNHSSLLLVGDVDSTRDTSCRQRIFFFLLDAIRKFYKQRLNQLIILPPPDIVTIVRNIRADESGEELNKFLLLLLGCAVQGDRKKEFIQRITRLGADTQKGIVQHIKKVTEGSSVVLPLTGSSLRTSDVELTSHLERVMRERDILAQQILHMTPDNESDEGSSTTATSSLNGDIPQRRMPEIRYERRSPSPTAFDRHSNVELASIKAEMRKLRNETEDKDDQINELRDVLEAKEEEIRRLQEKSLDLVKEARNAKDYRDELDCMQHKIMKVEKLESDNHKLMEKLTDLDYLKSTNERLVDEIRMLNETNTFLEDELQTYRGQSKTIQESESRLDEAYETIKSLRDDMREKNERISELLVEQSRLENQILQSNSKIAELERQMNLPSSTPRESFGSLADQLNESERNESIQLRLEVCQLRAQLDKEQQSKSFLNESSVSTTEDVELKKEIEVKNKEIDELKEENNVVTKQLHELEKTLSDINGRYKETSADLDSIKEEKEEAVKSLQEARRKFTQFQTEFGKKFEQETELKLREKDVELTEKQRRLESVEEERTEAERQLDRLREDQKRLRITVDELKEASHQSELQIGHLERSLKNSENEKNVTKDRCERLEDEMESLRMRMLTTDDASKRLENSEKLLVEQQNRLGDVEAENRTLVQQIDLESKKIQRLREDLIAEKARSAEIIGKLRSLCAAVHLNGGKMDVGYMDDQQLIEQIDDVMMNALTTAKREADALRLQQQTQIAELTDLRRDIEKLRRSESASLSESDDQVRELSKENVAIKEQVFLLQEKIREQQIEIAAKNSDIVVAKRDIEELNRNATKNAVSNTELARLQVSLRNLQLQEELLKQDNSELRSQLDTTEKSRLVAKKDADQLAVMHQALLGDHDRLQNLHDLLTQDYERTKQETQEMKARLRSQRVAPIVSSHRELDELRSSLNVERNNNDKHLRAYADLHNEHGALKRELDILRKEKDSMGRHLDNISMEERNLRVAEQNHRQTIRELTTTVDEMTKSLQMKDVEIAKLHNKVEMLTQLNRTYDEESKNLARQVEMLLQQNKELFNRALNDKDYYHQEQKDFQERLTTLRRHKEKLEEKIMDQYRSMESKKFPERKQPLVKRAAKALISRRRNSQPSSNGGSTTEDSSNYSADEAVNGSNGIDDDHFPPTCSSSDDVDRVSPRYETISSYQQHKVDMFVPSSFSSSTAPPVHPQPPPAPFRQRGDVIGGSVRVYGSRRPVINQYSTNGIDKLCELPSYLPPRAPVRNSSVTASLRARPPPPPYPKNKPPPPYRSSTPNNSQPPSPVIFAPQCASTPKSDRTSPSREVVAEGEQRNFVREKDERLDKAMSIYENVSTVEPGKTAPTESTVWYEYGCV